MDNSEDEKRGISRREFLETQFKLITSLPIHEKAFMEFEFGSMPEYRNSKEPIIVLGSITQETAWVPAVPLLHVQP